MSVTVTTYGYSERVQSAIDWCNETSNDIYWACVSKRVPVGISMLASGALELTADLIGMAAPLKKLSVEEFD